MFRSPRVLRPPPRPVPPWKRGSLPEQAQRLRPVRAQRTLRPNSAGGREGEGDSWVRVTQPGGSANSRTFDRETLNVPVARSRDITRRRPTFTFVRLVRQTGLNVAPR